MTNPSQQRRRDRLRFLQRLYDLSEGDVGLLHDGREVADHLGIALEEAGRIIRYYEERGYLRHLGGGGLMLRMTADGIDYIETLPPAS